MCLFGQLCQYDLGIQMKLMHQELIWSLHDDIPRLHGRIRKVPGVEGDDRLSAGAHRSCQDMPVLGVVSHRRHQLFITLDPAIPEVSPELPN